MSEPLRSMKQHSSAEHFEEFLRQGLVLPSNFSNGEFNTDQALQDAFEYWVYQFGQAMLPHQTALLCVNRDLRVINACLNNAPFMEEYSQTGVSWNFAEREENPLSRCLAIPRLHVMSGEELDVSRQSSMYAAAIPVLDSQKQPIAYLGLFSHFLTETNGLIQLLYTLSISFHSCVQSIEDRRRYDQLLLQNQQRELDFKKHDILFEASKKLHAKIDVDSVLTEAIECMYRVYPHIQVDLLLSQDNDSTNLSVKPLNFQSIENDICTRAFMESTVVFEPSKGSEGPSTGKVAAPLSGKQGVYGVLYMQFEHDLIHATDLQFISMLADTAGSAFENAKLYEQSNVMINELRLINEITKQLNQSLRLNEIFSSASSEILSIFGADFCCILQTDQDSDKLILQATNLPALFHETFTMDQGFSGQIWRTKEAVIISDYLATNKVKSKFMQLSNARSLIGSPILVNGRVEGVILVAHNKPNFFSYDNYKLLQVLSGHIGLAMTNASLHAEVKRMVITDNLTGLYARHYLDEQANLLQKKDFCGSLIVVDIDNFKRINDTHGHQIGDKILIQVSQIIKTCIRESDIAARWGGEELAVYLPQVAKDQTIRIAERIRTRVLKETSPQVTVSCGVSDWNWEEDKISVESLFYRADMALYQAKNSGRNQIKVG